MSEGSEDDTIQPVNGDRLAPLWRRIKEHRIAQWTAGYVAIAYGIQHAVTLTSEALDWPHAVTRVSFLLLALGLPIAITLAWYHGERASRRVSGPELTIISLLLVSISILFYAFVRPTTEMASTPARQEASLTAARAAAASPKGAISVAVLPFLNLSSDKDQEFFSDGMTEEITAALAKVADLRVVGRTSAFQFKGANKDLRAIGQALSATHLIEGSVRKAGNRVRITAQLIKADDGTHIWAEDYDRELTDIFAVQEDIARAITASLHMTLALKPGENLVNNRNIDASTYEMFLRALEMFSNRLGAADPEGLSNQEQISTMSQDIIARYPSYAPAWNLLGAEYFQQATRYAQDASIPLDQSRMLADSLRTKGEAAAKKAIELDSGLGSAYTVLGTFTWSRGRLIEAGDLLARGIATDGDNPATLFAYAIRLGSAGHVKDALALLEKSHALDPLIPGPLQGLALERWMNGDIDGAIALARTARPIDGAPLMAQIYASLGRFDEAAEALKPVAAARNSPAAKAAQLLRSVRGPKSAEELPQLPGNLQFAYLAAGATDRTIANVERAVDAGFVGGALLQRAWDQSYAPVRKTQRFKMLVRQAGFVDYWRAKGWPPQCHPTTGDDFECS